MSDAAIQIKKVVATLLSPLSTRNREIIARRFGLQTGNKETLESIGQSYSITRERVRQIEEASLAQIRETLDRNPIKPFVDLAHSIMEERGGVIQEDELFKQFSGSEKETSVNAALVFILTLTGTFVRIMDDDEVLTFWALSQAHADSFRRSADSFISALQKKGSVIPHAQLTSFINSDPMLGAVSSDTLASLLSISKNIGCNVFDEVGLTSSAEIKPRGVRDKAYLVLKKNTKPQHFRAITAMINESDFGGRSAHMQTVHNELIKDKRFVLVGRGIYGLGEWGYEPGTVKEVIASYIRQNGPSPKDSIVAHVMKTRLVKPNTVILGMQDKKLFVETDKEHVAFREA